MQSTTIASILDKIQDFIIYLTKKAAILGSNFQIQFVRLVNYLSGQISGNTSLKTFIIAIILVVLFDALFQICYRGTKESPFYIKFFTLVAFLFWRLNILEASAKYGKFLGFISILRYTVLTKSLAIGLQFIIFRDRYLIQPVWALFLAMLYAYLVSLNNIIILAAFFIASLVADSFNPVNSKKKKI